MTEAPRQKTLPISRSPSAAAVVAADLDLHVAHRLAAIDDRAVALRPVALARAAAGEQGLLDHLDDDAFARRHDRDRERRLGEAVARAGSSAP